MFEGIGTEEWVAAGAVAAAGAMLVAFVSRPPARRGLLALWLLLPGLLGAATSSTPDVATFLGLFLFLQLFPGTLWVVAAVPAFFLVRLLLHWRARRLRPGAGPPRQDGSEAASS